MTAEERSERRKDRLTRNEALFREVNERVEEVGERAGLDMIDFICECGDADCTAAISLTESEYEQIRAEPVLSSRSFRVTRFPRSKTSCPRAIASTSFASTTRKRTSPERPTLERESRHISIREKPPLPGAFRFRSGDSYGRNWLRKFLE